MTAVLGLDPSTKRTGVALPTGRTLALAPRTTVVADRLHWFAGALGRILDVYQPDLAVLEGYAPHSIGTLSTIRLAELGGVLRLTLFEHGVPYVEVPPSRLQRYGTGRGGADKDAMVAAARAAGAEVAGDDEADAWLLRALGVAGMGGPDLLDGDDPGHRLEIVADVVWPVIR